MRKMNIESFHAEIESIYAGGDERFARMKGLIAEKSSVPDELMRVAKVARDTPIIMREIDAEFEAGTDIRNAKDMSFLWVAVALQTMRWVLFNKIFARATEGNSPWEDTAHSAQDTAFGRTHRGRAVDNVAFARYGNYYVPFDQIISTHSVPYDALHGTKELNVGGEGRGLCPKNHRFKTLGHDPLLGFVFGTANIMTGTLTNTSLQTFFVNGSNVAYARAFTAEMFSKTAMRITEEPRAFGAALIKQALHIMSDAYTVCGIPLPFVSSLSPVTAEVLGKYGIDTGGLVKAGISAKTAALIDTLISGMHGLFYDPGECTIEQYQVRTIKILELSKIIAEGSNVIYTALSGDILRLDIGGIVYTIHRILKDTDFIEKIKLDYMQSAYAARVMG